MTVSLKGITISVSLLWGAAMLLVGIVHMLTPGYGAQFLQVMSSVYPGADTSPTVARVLLGTIYGLVDGAVAGYLFGLLYRTFAERPTAAHK